MSKQLFFAITCFLLIIILVSCTRYERVDPIGMWESDNPPIKMNIGDIYNEYYGVYNQDGEDVDIFIIFYQFNNLFSIKDIRDLHDGYITSNYEYFCGDYTVKGDKMYYKLLPHWQKLTGLKEIIFTKIEESEPLNETE